MIEGINPGAMDPSQRARLIYHQAQSALSNRLWQAALGTRGMDSSGANAMARGSGDMALDSLLALMGDGVQAARLMATAQQQAAIAPPPPGGPGMAPAGDETAQGENGSRESPPHIAPSGGPGPNAAYAGTLHDAAARTGIPAEVLGAIVNAEAARDGEGRWLAYSRNPRSSAAGLGQFLSGTWINEAERRGTWLNSLAVGNGWLDNHGHVRRDARSVLLEQRYDGHTSIQAVADYARSNLDRLGERGVPVGTDPVQIASAAYIGHHLGLGDAVRFLKGGLSEERAQHLLNAQIGTSAAARRIAAAGGSAASAHRNWLLHYVDSNLHSLRLSTTRGEG
ncbi:MAG TPA: peptidoglycan-binding protein [Sphingobium sp.]|uniref:peptidoglycan-binding protein n=1 Tax=Sphingobium sp. TaxID=1912891 RepID=UPI002ED43127